MENSEIEHYPSLQEILDSKEARQGRQRRFREGYKTVIVSITINMPGPIKDMPILRNLRDYAVQELGRVFNLVAIEQVNLVTGPEALVAIDAEGWRIKNQTIRLEEGYPFSRLLDLDVFTADGHLLSRREMSQSRGCFVCGRESAVCMREQKHSQEDLRLAIGKLLDGFKAYKTREISSLAEKLGALAVNSMLFEVACTPAPGLVDRNNTGAHHDMDFYSFMASSAALAMPMARCAQAGIMHEGMIESLLPVLRIIGLEGEKTMFAATGDVNTQKGLLFLLGIIVGVTGYLLGRQRRVTAEIILQSTAQMVTGIVERELTSATSKPPEEWTAGEVLYRIYGIKGIRGELAEGIPAVLNRALPALRQGLRRGLSVNDALVQTLLVLMTCVDDTTVMHRHHPDKMRVWVKEKAQEILAMGGMETLAGKDRCQALDAEFIRHNVSPGGVADLLAVTWFLSQVMDEF